MIARLWSYGWVVPMFALSTAAHGLVSYAISLFDHTPPRQLRVARAWARSLLWIAGVKVKVQGLEHIRPHASYVFVSNHTSYMDIPVILANIPEEFLFLAKDSLFRIPFMGTHLKTAGHVAVPREDPRAALRTLARTAELLRGGRSTLVFPEGGRTETGDLQPFKDGAAFVAIRAQIPIVPMALIGIREVLPMHSTVFRRAPVALRVGEPVSTVGLTIKDREALTQSLREKVVELSAHGPARPAHGAERPAH